VGFVDAIETSLHSQQRNKAGYGSTADGFPGSVNKIISSRFIRIRREEYPEELLINDVWRIALKSGSQIHPG
jgi:hypothetical protein